MIIEVRLK